MNSAKYGPTVVIGTIGLLMMLTGCLAVTTMPVVATSLTGVGGSVLATAIVNWILTRRLAFLPLDSIIEALARKVQFVRLQHEAEVTFTIEEGFVKLDRVHRYQLRNPSRFGRRHVISMFTDDPPSSIKRGGFIAVTGPDRVSLQGPDLDVYTNRLGGKHTFTKVYELQPGDHNYFEFRSFDYYRGNDRLIWTVQDLSDDFRIRLINNTGMSNPFELKINHHRQAEILERRRETPAVNEIDIIFDCEVLPYQGFEVMWQWGDVIERTPTPDKTKTANAS